MDIGKFFRGLAKVGDNHVSPETMEGMLELDDRLLGVRHVNTSSVPSVSKEEEKEWKDAKIK